MDHQSLNLELARVLRSATLRKFLQIYYYTYNFEKENNPLFPKPSEANALRRKPKIRPGLKAIKEYLGCDGSTAQRYLKAVQIMHDFVDQEIAARQKMKPLVAIEKPDFDKLRRDIPFLPKKTLVLKADRVVISDIRRLLLETADLVHYSPGVFTPNQCESILKELASKLIF